MAESPRAACNIRVHAEVRITDPVANTEHVEEGFRTEQWSYEVLATDRYLVSVPVYSAWFAAMDVARAKILDFSDQVVDMEIVYLRAQPRRPKQSFLYRSRRVRRRNSEGTRANWVTPRPRFGIGPGREAWPAWEMYSPHALRDHYLDHQEERFTANYGGGELKLRQISAPSTSATLDREQPQWRAVLFSDFALAIVFAVEILTISVAASEFPGNFVRGVFAAVGLATALLMGVMLAGNVTGWVPKGVSAIMPAVFFAMGTGLFWTVRLGSGNDPVFLVAILVAVVIVARGLTHLVKIRPRVRLLASLSVLTALVAISFGGARVFVSAVAGDSGVSLSSAAVPAWVMPVAGVFLLGCLLLGAIITGSTWGWFEYAGGSTAFRKAPEILASLLVLASVMIGMMAVVAAMTAAERLYSDWLNEFAEHKTPQITSDFMYRGCLFSAASSGSDGDPDSGRTALGQPVVVIEGEDGPQWMWEAEEAPEASSIDSTRIDAAKYQVVPVGDGVTTCAEASP